MIALSILVPCCLIACCCYIKSASSKASSDDETQRLFTKPNESDESGYGTSKLAANDDADLERGAGIDSHPEQGAGFPSWN